MLSTITALPRPVYMFFGISLSCLLLSRLRLHSLSSSSSSLRDVRSGVVSSSIAAAAASPPRPAKLVIEPNIKRTIIVGDVHGCADELRNLLQQIQFDKSKDKVIFVGDLVRKGPKSGEVVDIVSSSELNAASVRGNHDHYALLDIHNTLNLTPKQIDFLAKMPISLDFEFAGQQYCVVHAGLVPGTRSENNDVMDMMTMRNVIQGADGQLRATTEHSEGVAWASAWRGPPHVIFGHDAKRKIQRYEFATGLDSGVVYGGALTALVLPQHELIQVPSLQPKRHHDDG